MQEGRRQKWRGSRKISLGRLSRLGGGWRSGCARHGAGRYELLLRRAGIGLLGRSV